MNTHDLGDLVRVTGAFTVTSSGAAIDPDQVYVAVRNPNGTTTTYHYGVDLGVVKDSTGNYHYDVDANIAGIWYYRWHSTGNGQAAEEDSFEVKPALAM